MFDLVSYPEGNPPSGHVTFTVHLILDRGYLAIDGQQPSMDHDLDRATAVLRPWTQVRDYNLAIEAADRYQRRVILTVAGRTLTVERGNETARLLRFARLVEERLP